MHQFGPRGSHVETTDHIELGSYLLVERSLRSIYLYLAKNRLTVSNWICWWRLHNHVRCPFGYLPLPIKTSGHISKDSYPHLGR